MKKYIKTATGLVISSLLLLGTVQLQAQNMEKDVTIIELTQTTGEFVTKALNLKPGKYQFRVVNDNVEKDLGLVIQKAKDKNEDVMKTAVPNTFTSAYIKMGKHITQV